MDLINEISYQLGVSVSRIKLMVGPYDLLLEYNMAPIPKKIATLDCSLSLNSLLLLPPLFVYQGSDHELFRTLCEIILWLTLS